MTTETPTRTLIDAAAEHLPTVQHLHDLHGPTDQMGDAIHVFAIPRGYNLGEVDAERLLENPRRTIRTAELHDLDSFAAYIERNGTEATCVWVDLDPVTSQLKMRAVINDHLGRVAGWRDHLAVYSPRLSVEWQRWTAMAGKPTDQAPFAAWLEDNLVDVAAVEGLPTGAQMLAMLLDFEAKQDMRFKSAVRLQSGGVRMEYIDTDDAATVARMDVFDRFALGLPVFWGSERYRLDARLRYRAAEGRVKFWFDLVRADRVLEDAARNLIAKLRDDLSAKSISCPVPMGK